MRVFAFLAAASTVVSSARSAAPTRIEQLVYVYSPNGDRKGAYSLYDTPAMLVQWAAQHGMDVTLVNADDVYLKAVNWDDRKNDLLATLRNLGKSRNTIYWIATHGKEISSERGSDTELTFYGKYESVSYSEIAKVLDPMPQARGVIVDACHGYCDALKNSANQGAGKLVAAIATQDNSGNYAGAHVLAQSLAQLIASPKPVKLGAEFYAGTERAIANCAKSQETTDKSDEAKVESGLFTALPQDPKERMLCSDQKLTIRDGLGEQKFLFGGGAGKIRDAFGHEVKLCRSMRPGQSTTYMPGRLYDVSQVFGEPIRRNGSYPVAKNPALEAFYFICQPSGEWGLARNSARNASHDRCREDPKCQAPGHRYIKIASCRQPMSELLNLDRPARDSEFHYEDSYRTPNEECLGFQEAYAELAMKKVDLGNWDSTALCLTERTKITWGGDETLYAWCPVAKDRAPVNPTSLPALPPSPGSKH